MASIVSEEVLLCVGVVGLTMCICLDVYTAYDRGAQWLPGRAVVIYALCLQLVGYLDVQNVSTGSTHKDHQLQVLVSNQLSIDSSRLVLFVFVGYLVPNLASTPGFWTNIAALFTSVSNHIAIELSVALHSRIGEKDKEVKGQSGIWLIVSGFVFLESMFVFSWLVVWAIIRGRFIRDNLGSRIPLAVQSLEDNNEIISWDYCQSEMLKSWIVARVCQPEYVLNRSPFSYLVASVVTFNVVVMGAKVVSLRSQLHGPFPLFTIQCIFIILGWFVVSYRCYFTSLRVHHRISLRFDKVSTARCISTINVLSNKIESSVFRFVVKFGLLFFFFLPMNCLIMPIGLMGIFLMMIVSAPALFCMLAWVAVLTKTVSSAPPEDEDQDEDEDEDFSRYKKALDRVCMPQDMTNNLWVANKSSFNHTKQCIEQAYERGNKRKNLQKVIGSRLAQNIPSTEDVKELLEPLESVKMYFPLLNDSFRRITGFVLLMVDIVSEDHHSVREIKRDVRSAFEETKELMDFLDCPDNIGISLDIFNISNLEAFILRDVSVSKLKRARFNFRESSTVANAVEKLLNEAKNKLEMCNLLGDVNSQAVDTKWDDTAEAYAMYKLCKLILDRHQHDSVEQLHNYLINMAADLIAMSVTESPKILVERSRKWSAEFREDNISVAIKLVGFACGVIDRAKEQHLQQPV